MHNTPDFTITGGRFDGKVWLLASKSLYRFELEDTTEYSDIHSWGYADPLRVIDRRVIQFRVGMRDYVQVFADTYGEAWSSLFNVWSPPVPERPELANPKQIEQ